MWIVNRADVGSIAYNRLHRDGAIRTVIPGVAVPQDVVDSPALRREALLQFVPPGCQVTALGVLWVLGHTQLPGWFDIRAPKGRHVRNWDSAVPLTFHAIGTATAVGPAGGLGGRANTHRSDGAATPFADVATAIADALRWTPLNVTVPAVMRALSASPAHVSAAVSRRLANTSPACEAWTYVQRAMTTQITTARIGVTGMEGSGAA